MTEQEYLWHVKFPGDFYAVSFRLNSTDERKARKSVRERLSLNRLPKGTELWKRRITNDGT
jgi:hypothetical protein